MYILRVQHGATHRGAYSYLRWYKYASFHQLRKIHPAPFSNFNHDYYFGFRNLSQFKRWFGFDYSTCDSLNLRVFIFEVDKTHVEFHPAQVAFDKKKAMMHPYSYSCEFVCKEITSMKQLLAA